LFIEDEELNRGEIINLFFQQIQYCGTGSKHSNPFFPHRALVDHIRKYGNKYTKIASEALLENLRCSNLLLMHVYSIIIPTFLRASHYVYKVSHNCTNRMFLPYSSVVCDNLIFLDVYLHYGRYLR
jgi:hypothetical protein